MIEEFAVDPALLGTDFQTARFYLTQVGYEHGRVLVRCPKSFWKEVKQGSGLEGAPDVSRKRWVELINKAKRSSRLRRSRPDRLDGESWVEHALKCHRSSPFRMIISSGELPNSEVTPDAEAATHPLWTVPTSVRIARSAEAIADVVEPVVRDQAEVHLVDQYFRPDKIRALGRLFERLGRPDRPVAVVVHASSENWGEEPLRQRFQTECEEQLERFASVSRSFRIRLHAKEEHKEGIHNRYVLTRDVGIVLGWGFDAKPGQKDDVSLTSEQQLTDLLRQWCNAKPLFEFDVVAQSTATSAKRT